MTNLTELFIILSIFGLIIIFHTKSDKEELKENLPLYNTDKSEKKVRFSDTNQTKII